MGEHELIGYAVLAVITLGAFVSVIMKLVEPINDLRVVIQKLNDVVDTMKRDNESQTKEIAKHGEEINKLDNRVGKIETKMSLYHKE